MGQPDADRSIVQGARMRSIQAVGPPSLSDVAAAGKIVTGKPGD